jgi:cytochrome P450
LNPSAIRIEELSSPVVIADPYPYYAALRDRSPIFGYRDLPPGTIPGTDEPPPSWAVLSHAQVTEVAKRVDVFSSRDPLQEASGAPTLMLVHHDDPTHAALRARVQRFFTSSAVARHQAWLETTTATMLKDLVDSETDVMKGIAADLPARVMTRMLGVPIEEFPRFRRWATAFMLSAPLSPDERSRSNADMLEFFSRFVAEAATAPDEGDLVGSLLRSGPDQIPLSVEEVVRFCFTLVVAGSETTTGLLGNLFWIAATQPDAYRALRADPALTDRFIEEALRWAGPPQRLFRIATEDYALGGQTIRAGDWVAVFFGAANHDPVVWAAPDSFRLDRLQGRAHYTFGHGIHQCLGAMLVRLEARTLLNALTAVAADVEPLAFKRQTATQLSYALDECRVRLR